MSEDITEALVKGITQIANYNLHKKHVELNIKEWQTEKVLEALELFKEEWDKTISKP
tara:strand:- start:31488 stop:31658 length:171 start_codon:yes stop_codon:yes gene_type:complete